MRRCMIFLLAATAMGGESGWSWQRPHAEISPAGDLAWAPEPHRFAAGREVRHIDFANGSDDAPGTRERPWKHHPWDPQASGLARTGDGPITYVFRRGVVYRGCLVARGGGLPDQPVRLTSDPSWGDGDAEICGSETAIGWTRASTHPDIPDREQVWHIDLPFQPRCVWLRNGTGEARRIPLARTPNWTVSDPEDVKSGWWSWDHAGAKHFGNYATVRGLEVNLGIDSRHLTMPRAYYQDALVWTESGWVMGAPFPVPVLDVDGKRHGLAFQGRYGGARTYHIIRGCRYYLEDKPHYLDDPLGEFWFERKGQGGRLHLRLPGGADPNTAPLEIASRSVLLDAARLEHTEISGLAFRFTNVSWRLDAGLDQREEADVACIRLRGSGKGLRIANCRFEHVNGAVQLTTPGLADTLDDIAITDNAVLASDRGGFVVSDASPWGEVAASSGRLLDVRILRNSLREIGLRPLRYDLGFAIDVLGARTLEIAGNVIARCYSGGINVSGGKRSGSARDCPLIRILIHHNKVTDSLLSNDDFGGIETWQSGPAYVFANISRNPGGYRHFLASDPKQPGWARFGHAYYLDGAFKNYHFNNIAWGGSSDPFSRLGSASAFQEIVSYQNTFFNNTIYNVVKGSRRQAPDAGRDKFLGNLWQDIGETVFWHAPPGKNQAAIDAAVASGTTCDLSSNAYARNVFHRIPGSGFGILEPSGTWLGTPERFREALVTAGTLATQVGVTSPTALLRDPAHGDFRPQGARPAGGGGVRVFVPWPLHATVAEWHFCQPGRPGGPIIDEHWYLTPYHLQRADYHTRPSHPLETLGIRPEDFVAGPLEDWTAGALRLNGRDQYARVPHAGLAAPFAYAVPAPRGQTQKGVPERRSVAGPELRNPQVHQADLLIEMHVRIERTRAGAILVQKRDGDAGYALLIAPDGRASFQVAGGGRRALVATRERIDDGAWHHLIAECDRSTARLTLYLDGHADASAPGFDATVSLANAGDLLVGGSPDGDCLAGGIDFLRLAQGTLASSRTTIEELYAWQFAGPFLRDFTGRTRPADSHAGAVTAE